MHDGRRRDGGKAVEPASLVKVELGSLVLVSGYRAAPYPFVSVHNDPVYTPNLL